MIIAKNIWYLVRNCWSKAVDAAAALLVFFCVLGFIFSGNISPASRTLSDFMPIITFVIFISLLLFLMFFMALREVNKWKLYKKWLWTGFHFAGLLFACYQIAITQLISGLPLSNWMVFNHKGSWFIFGIFFILALVIVFTGKDIRKVSS